MSLFLGWVWMVLDRKWKNFLNTFCFPYYHILPMAAGYNSLAESKVISHMQPDIKKWSYKKSKLSNYKCDILKTTNYFSLWKCVTACNLVFISVLLLYYPFANRSRDARRVALCRNGKDINTLERVRDVLKGLAIRSCF